MIKADELLFGGWQMIIIFQSPIWIYPPFPSPLTQFPALGLIWESGILSIFLIIFLHFFIASNEFYSSTIFCPPIHFSLFGQLIQCQKEMFPQGLSIPFPSISFTFLKKASWHSHFCSNSKFGRFRRRRGFGRRTKWKCGTKFAILAEGRSGGSKPTRSWHLIQVGD